MKKLSAVLIVLVLLVVGVGFYRGWFTLSSPAAPGSDKVNVNLTMDKGKIKEDAESVKNKATELTGKVTEQVQGSGSQVNENP